MRRWWSMVVVGAVLLLVFGELGAATATAAGGGSISGRVTGSAGAPIADAAVAAYAKGGGFVGASPLPDGTWTLLGLPPDTYDVSVSAPGFVRAYLPPITVADGQSVTGVEVVLQLAGSITGTVTGPDAVGLPGVGVAASGAAGGIVETTGSDGTYRIDGLVPGGYTITFSKLGSPYPSLTYPLPVRVVAGATTSGIDMRLSVGGSISGTVTGPDGSPLPGVTVAPSGSSAPTMTRSDGTYLLQGLPAGAHTLFFGIDGSDYVRASYPGTVTVADGRTTTGIDIRLQLGGSISGHVTDGRGAPVARASVTADGPALGAPWAETDANGAYRIPGLPDGHYTVTAHRPFPDTATASYGDLVVVTAGRASTGIDLRFGQPTPTPGPTPRPTVTPAPTATPGPVPGTAVRVISPADRTPVTAGSRITVTATTTGIAAGTDAYVTVNLVAVAGGIVDPSGRVRFLNVPARTGAYRVRIGPGPARLQSAPFRLDIRPFGITSHRATQTPAGVQERFVVATGYWATGTPITLTRNGHAVTKARVTTRGRPLAITVPRRPGLYQVQAPSGRGWVLGATVGVVRLT